MQNLLQFLIPTVLTGLAGSWIAYSGLKSYDVMNKSALTPPKYVFGIVWTLIYILIIVAGYLYFQKVTNSNTRANFLSLFYVQLLLNFIWVVAFFRNPSKDNARLSLMILLFLFLSVVWLACWTWNVSKWSSVIFFAYAAWCLYAAVLNLSFISLN